MQPSVDAHSSSDGHPSTIGQDECELGLRGLTAALGAADILCMQLSACSGLQAMTNPTPQSRARAAFIHAAARFLRQACLILDPDAAKDDWRNPAVRLMQLGAQHTGGCLQAAVTDEQTLPVEAMTALAFKAGALAAHAPRSMASVLTSIQACVKAAASQLQAARALTCIPATANRDLE